MVVEAASIVSRRSIAIRAGRASPLNHERSAVLTCRFTGVACLRPEEEVRKKDYRAGRGNVLNKTRNAVLEVSLIIGCLNLSHLPTDLLLLADSLFERGRASPQRVVSYYSWNAHCGR